MITIQKYNEVHLKILSDDFSALAEISEKFTFDVEGYKFMPAYRSGAWDGKIRLYSMQTKKMYLGLLGTLRKFLNDMGYEYELKGFDKPNNITLTDVKTYIESLDLRMDGNKLEDRDYQTKAVYESLHREKLLFTVPTSGGKTSLTYSIVRWYLDKGLRTLIIVPTKELVTQSFNDFKDYSSHNGFDVDLNMHKIVGGSEKNTECGITVSTWQSIYKLDAAWFDQFDVVIFDEAHKATSKELSGIMDKTVNVKYKVGMTGTVQDAKTNRLVLEGLFGEIVPIITTKELMDMGFISNLKIQALLLTYDDETKQDAMRYMRTQENGRLGKKVDYQKEIDFIVSNESRNNFIANLAVRCDNTTLVLFNYVERHGVKLYELIRAKNPDAIVYMLDGSSSIDERALVKEEAKNKPIIILASYALYSTGVSIPAIANVIFAHPTKSKIRVLQSIGRGLRLFKGKSFARLFDIADDLSYKTSENHSLKHFRERLELYIREDFDYVMNTVKV